MWWNSAINPHIYTCGTEAPEDERSSITLTTSHLSAEVRSPKLPSAGPFYSQRAFQTTQNLHLHLELFIPPRWPQEAGKWLSFSKPWAMAPESIQNESGIKEWPKVTPFTLGTRAVSFLSGRLHSAHQS